MKETVHKLRKNRLYKVAIAVLAAFLAVGALYALGFRITYNPNIITDWTAVGAVGQWCSIVASIFVVYLSTYLSREFEQKTKDIANSNRASAEFMSEVEKKIDEKIKLIADMEGKNKIVLSEQEEKDIQQRIVSYIEISIVTTTNKIAKYIDKSIQETFSILKKMEDREKNIMHIGDNSNLSIEELLWKINS